jgi:hypothetical protein
MAFLSKEFFQVPGPSASPSSFPQVCKGYRKIIYKKDKESKNINLARIFSVSITFPYSDAAFENQLLLCSFVFVPMCSSNIALSIIYLLSAYLSSIYLPSYLSIHLPIYHLSI